MKRFYYSKIPCFCCYLILYFIETFRSHTTFIQYNIHNSLITSHPIQCITTIKLFVSLDGKLIVKCCPKFKWSFRKYCHLRNIFNKMKINQKFSFVWENLLFILVCYRSMGPLFICVMRCASTIYNWHVCAFRSWDFISTLLW